jgi:hypothetical protein
MIAALSLDGYEGVYVVPGSIDGEEFLDFIINDMVHCYMFYLIIFLLTTVKLSSSWQI